MAISVTEALKLPEVRHYMREHFPVPTMKFPDIIAPSLTKNYSIIGQAFDYLMRFYLERNYSCTHRDQWIAEIGVTRLVLDGWMDEHTRLRPMIDNARQKHFTYLDNGIVTGKLFESCIDLAYLDKLVRIGRLVYDTWQYDDLDLLDMDNLYTELLKVRNIEEPIVLDPLFRGFPIDGNPDLVAGSCIVDIKATNESRIRSDNYWQVVLYAMLASRYKSNPAIVSTIDSVGFYYARHGILVKFPLTINDADMDALLDIIPQDNVRDDRYEAVITPIEEVANTDFSQRANDMPRRMTIDGLLWYRRREANDKL